MKDIPVDAKVEATDGHVGQVEELLRDEGSGEVSYLILQEGHLWGKKEVVLPVATIDKVEGDTVYLKLGKDDIERLPAYPVTRQRDKEDAKSVELVARVFDDTEKAAGALEFVEDLQRRRVIKILNAAVLVREEDGTTTMRDVKEMEPKRAGLIGAVTGGLIGLVGGPVGMVVGALAGAGVGGLAAKKIDAGFSDKFLAALQEHLQPGSSALVLLAEHEWLHSMAESMDDIGGVVLQQTITDELAAELLAEAED